MASIQGTFGIGMGLAGLILCLDLALLVRARSRRARDPRIPPEALDRRGYFEGGVILWMGSLATAICVGMPVVWLRPGQVPDLMLVVSGYGLVAAGPLSAWGLLSLRRAIDRSGGHLGHAGGWALSLPWLFGAAIVVGSLVRRL